MLTTLFYALIFFQQGDFIPTPKDAKPNQQFGNYSFLDFVSENWFFLAAIGLMIVLVLFYIREKKRMAKKEEEENNKSKWN